MFLEIVVLCVLAVVALAILRMLVAPVARSVASITSGKTLLGVIVAVLVITVFAFASGVL